MEALTFIVNSKFIKALGGLKKRLKRTDGAEVLEMGVALLSVTVKASEEGSRLCLVDDSKKLIREILIPNLGKGD